MLRASPSWGVPAGDQSFELLALSLPPPTQVLFVMVMILAFEGIFAFDAGIGGVILVGSIRRLRQQPKPPRAMLDWSPFALHR
jgi:hypothetical protein